MAFLVKKTIKQLEKWHENCPWVEQRTAPHRNNRITFLFEGNENSGKRHPCAAVARLLILEDISSQGG